MRMSLCMCVVICLVMLLSCRENDGFAVLYCVYYSFVQCL